MRTYRATVYHAGRQNHQIPKTNMSAAEIILLKSIHGPHAVVDIYELESNKVFRYKKQDNRGSYKIYARPADQKDEKIFLVERYGEEVFSKVFPGFSPVLPVDLAQIGVEFVPFGQEHSNHVQEAPETIYATNRTEDENEAAEEIPVDEDGVPVHRNAGIDLSNLVSSEDKKKEDGKKSGGAVGSAGAGSGTKGRLPSFLAG